MLKLQFCRQTLLAFNMPKAIFIALIVLASNLRSGKKLFFSSHIIQYKLVVNVKKWVDINHGLRTPSKGKFQRFLKNWADVADKICFGRI